MNTRAKPARQIRRGGLTTKYTEYTKNVMPQEWCYSRHLLQYVTRRAAEGSATFRVFCVFRGFDIL